MAGSGKTGTWFCSCVEVLSVGDNGDSWSLLVSAYCCILLQPPWPMLTSQKQSLLETIITSTQVNRTGGQLEGLSVWLISVASVQKEDKLTVSHNWISKQSNLPHRNFLFLFSLQHHCIWPSDSPRDPVPHIEQICPDGPANDDSPTVDEPNQGLNQVVS